MTDQPLLHGDVRMPARTLPWQDQLLADHQQLTSLIDEHGSPVNLIRPEPLAGHAHELVDAAAVVGVELRVFFARKANKALALVEAALEAGHGIDVASERELTQVLGLLDAHGLAPDRVILTAAIKPEKLLRVAVEAGVSVSVDNDDEFALLADIAAELGRRTPVAIRISPQIPDEPRSRFGVPAARAREWLAEESRWQWLRLAGWHFHVHGYAASHRAVALVEALSLSSDARDLGHEPDFVDIGGGVPMRYLDSSEPWQEFVSADSQTWQDRPLGSVYPLWQDRVRGEWISDLLAHPHEDRPLAEHLVDAGLRLHAEPGRSLLDGCGLTVARVEMVKEYGDDVLVGLAMNRTQCRSAADDFVLDPVLIRSSARTGPADGAPAVSGYLVGAYCIEAELLTWRRLHFPAGVRRGDLVAFINTAGYQMHILESASHQIRLARNLVPGGDGWVLDQIEDAP